MFQIAYALRTCENQCVQEFGNYQATSERESGKRRARGRKRERESDRGVWREWNIEDERERQMRRERGLWFLLLSPHFPLFIASTIGNEETSTTFQQALLIDVNIPNCSWFLSRVKCRNTNSTKLRELVLDESGAFWKIAESSVWLFVNFLVILRYVFVTFEGWKGELCRVELLASNRDFEYANLIFSIGVCW